MAEMICRKRGRGKTLKLIQECFYRNREDGGNYTYILVADGQRAHWLFNFAKEKQYNIPYPITVNEIMHSGLAGSFIKNLLVDDAEEVLECFIGRGIRVPMLTMRKEEE